ncbi:MAG: hypothetical protein IPI34_14330 [bacterium]|nr:hypothetical protein [bacterium]
MIPIGTAPVAQNIAAASSSATISMALRATAAFAAALPRAPSSRSATVPCWRT